MQVQLGREQLWATMEQAARVAAHRPEGERKAVSDEIAYERELFERVPGATLQEMSSNSLERAESGRRSAQACRWLGLAAGGGLMVAGYAAGATGMMGAGLGVMMGVGMLGASFFESRGRKMLDASQALLRWQQRFQEPSEQSQEVDRMLDAMRTRIDSGDLDGALEKGLEIVKTQEQVIVGGVPLSRHRREPRR